jgi:hypothetical protein
MSSRTRNNEMTKGEPPVLTTSLAQQIHARDVRRRTRVMDSAESYTHRFTAMPSLGR